MNTYGSGLAIAALVGLLLAILVLAIVAVLAFLSWKWSRRGASFRGLAFPVVLPLFAIAICLMIGGSRTQPTALLVWIGVWTAVACAIWGRAIWLRPGEDGGDLSVRRRRRDILLSAVAVGISYAVWGGLTLVEAARFRRWLDTHRAQEAENRARRIEEWNAGRIVTNASALAYSRDSRWLAVMGYERDGGSPYLEIWDLTTGERYHRYSLFSRKRYVNLQFDGSGTHLAMQVDHEVEVYDLERKLGPTTLLAGPKFSLDYDNHISFLDGQNAIVVLQNGKAHAFQVATGEPLPITLPALEQSDIQAFAISRDSQWHATWSRGRKQIAVWRAGESAPAWTADKIEANHLLDLQFSSDGAWLALSTPEQTILVWNAMTGAEQQRLTAGGWVKCFRFTEDCQQLAAVTHNDQKQLQVFLWNVTTGQLDAHHTLPVISISGAVLDSKGKELAADVFPSSRDEQFYLQRTIQRYDTVTCEEHRGFTARE